MRRAAVSVASNIAEAAGRSSDPDSARLLSIAAGSASELQYQLELSIQLGYASVDAKRALEKSHEVKRMLRSLIRAWTTRQS
jgi:four helix bundle protein